MVLANKVINQTGAIREFEKPEVCEAIKVANANKWTVGLSPIEWDEREARLKEEYEKNTKAPGPGYPLSAVEGAKLKWKDNKNTSENPALKEAASQFNDSLLDEQAKKIEKLIKENEDWKSWNALQNRAIAINNIAFRNEKNRLGKEIARLNKIIHKKNMKIEELRKESSEHLRGKVKLFGETVDLSQEICDKNEELRLTKIREKNLAELGLKYVGENEKLKKELADKVVGKIDAQALKSAESALAEKDEVIADLGNELAATKKELEEKTKLVEIVRNDSKQYCYYGIAAEKMIQKMAKVIVKEGPVTSEDYKEYRRLANGYRYNPQLPELSEEEEKKLSPFNDDNPHGEVTNQKDISPSLKVTVRLFGDDVRDLFKSMQHLW